MAIFTMSDLHLSLDTNKSMEVFGGAWDRYIERIYDNWNSLISSDDTIVIGGDISWAMNLEDCKKDFEFLNSLPGRKLLFKGNHDYWWESLTKMKAFTQSNGFDTISFMQNDAVIIDDILITGSRGWILPGETSFKQDDNKIYQRELLRLRLSLEKGMELLGNTEPSAVVCVLHYPPFTRDNIHDENITSVFKEYGVTDCFFGHLHSASVYKAFQGMHDGVKYSLTSADYLGFKPIRIDN